MAKTRHIMRPQAHRLRTRGKEIAALVDMQLNLRIHFLTELLQGQLEHVRLRDRRREHCGRADGRIRGKPHSPPLSFGFGRVPRNTVV